MRKQTWQWSMRGVRLGFLVLPMVLAAGCASLGDSGGRDRISLQANRLTVPLAEKEPHKGHQDQRYALYRLRLSTEPARNHARLLVKKRKSIHISIDTLAVTTGVARDGWVTFELPSNLEVNADCYVMVSAEWAIPRASEKTLEAKYLIGLEPFGALAELAQARRRMDATRRRIDEAGRDLPRNHAFIKDACTLPPVSLPARPREAMDPKDAEELAEAIVIEAMAERMGCDEAAEVLHGLGLIGEWERFGRRFTCGRTDLHELMPRDELTPIVDYFESRLLSCANQNKLTCALLYALVLKTRFETDRDRIAGRLSAPYRKWQNETEAIQQRARDDLRRCNDLFATVAGGPAAMQRAYNAVTVAESRVRAVKAQNGGVDSKFGAGSLRCTHMVTDYVYTGR